ncbi:hypothetical protein [Mycolicibacterium holsaticum]|uniref:hypothetical protein n=1 Tax=Mycolicibacterium holsaticum TaxID=152142 RepID=UPI000A3F7890|nr:hypothetical protein [Mycolicibacterium holsaticum]
MQPFLGTEALSAGVVTRYQLATRYDALFRNVYVPKDHPVTALDKAIGAWLWSGRRATAAGLSAAALHGSRWIDARMPAELNQSSRHKTTGILLHSDTLRNDEVCVLNGVPATTAARTAFDLGRRGRIETAVLRIDALMQATGLKAEAVGALVECHRGARGLVNLRKALELSDPGAESPQETRTRLVLTAAGLRPTHTQIDVYDGLQHWTDPRVRNRDIERPSRVPALRCGRQVRISGVRRRCW